MTRRHGRPVRAALAAALASAFPALALAQTPPDAGETLRELQQRPDLEKARPAPTLMVPADADTGADPGIRFTVRSIAISGNASIPTAELEPLVADVAGREVTLGELRAAAARITALYRERGFVVARGFVPAQEIADGAVRITVLEGSLNSTTVLNDSKVRTPVLEGIVAAQRLDGRIIQSAETDRELLLIADLPAIGKVSGNLKPGQEVGTSDMFISVEPGRAYEGDVSADNYGNRYTGQARLNGRVAANSPFGLGDRLSLGATVTEEKLWYGRLAYDLPAGNDGLRVGAALSTSHYELGHEFNDLDARGTADTAGLYGSYPVVRGLNRNFWLSGAVDYRKLKDEIRSTDSETNKAAVAVTLAAYGDWSDSAGGGAYSTWRISGAAGHLDIHTDAAKTIDAAGPRTDGRYEKLELAASRLQAITSLTSLFVSFDSQIASRNLDSSEKFVIGGPYAVRAYPQGEGAGDDGWIGTAELRQAFTAGIEASLFYDIGRVKFNDEAYTQLANHQWLSGYGVAVGGRYDAFNLKLTVAMRTSGEAETAPDKRPRFWASAGWAF